MKKIYKLIKQEIFEKPSTMMLYCAFSAFFCITLGLFYQLLYDMKMQNITEIIMKNCKEYIYFEVDESTLYPFEIGESGGDEEARWNYVKNKYSEIMNELAIKYQVKIMPISTYAVDKEYMVYGCDELLFENLILNMKAGRGFSDNPSEVLLINGNKNKIGRTIEFTGNDGVIYHCTIIGVLKSPIFISRNLLININHISEFIQVYEKDTYLINPVIGDYLKIPGYGMLEPVFIHAKAEDKEMVVNKLKNHGKTINMEQYYNEKNDIVSGLYLFIGSMVLFITWIIYDVKSYIRNEKYMIYKLLGMTKAQELFLVVFKNMYGLLVGLIIANVVAFFLWEVKIYIMMMSSVIVLLMYIICIYIEKNFHQKN